LEPQCQVRLEVFEGPLDLLLYLINRDRLDIADIPIALVTAQYLEYLDFMHALDLAVAGEYLVMAATLIQIKSRMLLPGPEPLGPEDDPRFEITRPLKELLEMKEAARRLDARAMLGRDVFTRDGDFYDQGFLKDSLIEEQIEADLLDLISAFRSVIGKERLPKVIELEEARCDLALSMEYILGRVSGDGVLSCHDLFSASDRRRAVCMFIALLELARQGKVRLVQETMNGDITVLMREISVSAPAAYAQ
jgi:segregation and condensation protein A